MLRGATASNWSRRPAKTGAWNDSRSIRSSSPDRVSSSLERSSTPLQSSIGEPGKAVSHRRLGENQRGGDVGMNDPQQQARQAQHGHDRQGEHRQPDRERDSPVGLGPPLGQRVGADVGPHVVAQEGHVGAEVQAVAEFGHRHLPPRNLGGGRGVAEPVGQDRLAPRRPRGAEALEQRPGAEQVKVGGVGVLLVEKPRPSGPCPGPVPGHPRDPPSVISGDPLAPPPSGHDPPVPAHQAAKQDDHPHRPRPAHGPLPRQDRQDQEPNKQPEPDVARRVVQSRNCCFASAVAASNRRVNSA